MSTLVMSQKVMKLMATYEIKQNGVVKYTGKRKALTLGEEFEICDANGKRVGYVDQKLVAMVKSYKLMVNGTQVDVVKKKVPALTKDLKLESRGWKVDGDALGVNFNIIDAQKNVYGSIKKKIVAIGDTYEIESVNDEDEILFVLLAIVVDEVFHSKRS